MAATRSRRCQSPSQPVIGASAAATPAAPTRKDQTVSTQPDVAPFTTAYQTVVMASDMAAARMRRSAAAVMAQIPKIGCSMRPMTFLKRILPSRAARQMHSPSLSTTG